MDADSLAIVVATSQTLASRVSSVFVISGRLAIVRVVNVVRQRAGSSAVDVATSGGTA